MPDTEQASRSTAPSRLAPDFTPLALTHLQLRCDAFREHVRGYVEQPAIESLKALIQDVTRIRNTLTLLNRPGGVLVCDELVAMLMALVNNAIDDADEAAHVMVLAGEKLNDYVAYLRQPHAFDSVLPLLPLLNNCRACRGESLMSEALVLAAGIELPKGPSLPLPGDVDLTLFVNRVQASRQPLMRGLLNWYRDVAGLDRALDELAELFAGLSAMCNSPTALQPLVPLLDSAAVICRAVQQHELDNSAALKRLFAQVERLLERCSRLRDADAKELATLVPESLFRNLLYYVGLAASSTPTAMSLRERYRLDRFVPDAHTVEQSRAALEGVGERLADSIRDSIDVETAALRQWLAQATNDQADLQAANLRERLLQLEPVLKLLGAFDALNHLEQINRSLAKLISWPTADHTAERLLLAETLIRLDRALDDTRHTQTGDDESATADSDDAFVACVEESRRRIRLVCEEFATLFNRQVDAALDNTTPTDGEELTLASVAERLQPVQQALAMLPLVEVVSLLSTVRELLSAYDASELLPAARQDLATLMVSVEYYLSCVLQPQPAGEQLLAEAQQALTRLQSVLTSNAAAPALAMVSEDDAEATLRMDAVVSVDDDLEVDDNLDATVALVPMEASTEALVDQALLQMGIVTDQLSQLRRARRTDPDLQSTRLLQRQVIDHVLSAYRSLSHAGAMSDARDIHRLAQANLNLLRAARGPESLSNLPNESFALLEESAAVLPQLIDQLQGNSDQVRGLDTLLNDLSLQAAAVSGAAVAGSVIGDEVQVEKPTAVERRDVTSNTLGKADSQTGNDADVLDVTEADGTAALTLDSTLQQVFFRECDSHIQSLSAAIGRALGNTDNAPQLPSESMLRALHTLTGSAQTVDARAIVAIVQPLQRVALLHHRSGQTFNRRETHFIRDAVHALQARVVAMEHGTPVTAEVIEIEQTLVSFVAQAETLASAQQVSNSVAPRSPPLTAVFREEADELMDSLAADATLLDDVETRDASYARALSALHTLKGSARMADYAALADRAHSLEAELQDTTDAREQRRLLDKGLTELQGLLMIGVTDAVQTADALSNRPVSEQAHGQASLSLSEATFEQLLSLATDTSVSHARLGDGLAQLRDACRDLASTAERLRCLPHDNVNIGSPAVLEMLADLDTARHVIEDGLRSAETEQLQGSRAGSTLQQALIRAQLVRWSECGARLRRVLDDAAREYDRQVKFELSGGELTVDRTLYRRLLGPLEHLVRNAVVHGIESNSVRREMGKSEHGRVWLDVTVDGAELVLSISDNGAGIDRDRVNDKRVADGQAPVDGIEGLRDALCHPGFSTMADVSQVAGRGLGLSAVQQAVEELGGALSIGTQSGRGTSITLRLPQQVVVNQVVLVQQGDTQYALPVNFVHEVQTGQQHDNATEEQHASRFNGNTYAHETLANLLGTTADSRSTPRSASAPLTTEESRVLVAANTRRLAIVVDRVLGYREIIAQPLGPQLATLQSYSGGSVLADGRHVLILDLHSLLRRRATPARETRIDLSSNLPVALIVDDSITMRVAAEQMLEQRGMNTLMARDGAEALETLRQSLPDVLIVDIDMPKMNGFDLLRHLRLLYPEHNLPIIMISSRQGEADRTKARSLGVSCFLGKPYEESDLHDALLDTGIRLPDITIA